MRSKKIFSIFLAALLLVTTFTGAQALSKDSFSPNKVLSIIKDITSRDYRGRLVGDKGNLKTQEYIEKYFKKLGLEPGGKSKTFLQPFEAVVPLVNDTCFLKVMNNNNVVKEYKYGSDFKESPYGASASGTVLGYPKTKLSETGNILLLANGRIGEQIVDYEMDIALKEKGIRAIVYPTNMNYRFRSPYKLQASYPEGLVKVMVTKKVFDELSDYSKRGYTLEIKSSVEIKKVMANNVVGILRGKNPSLPPLILSAHFDHVGLDADGTLYPGAFDNASGTALLLECARVLKSLGPQDRTIIFTAFNAEEVGLVGSEYFVHNPPVNIKEAECINFDMVAAPKNMPLSILSYGADESFASELQDVARASGIEANLLNENNSDHGPFCVNGIKAVTLIYNDPTRIHTPEDNLQNIDTENTLQVFSLLSSYLRSRNIETAFSHEVISNSENETFLKVSLILVVLFGVIVFSKNRNTMQSR